MLGDETLPCLDGVQTNQRQDTARGTLQSTIESSGLFWGLRLIGDHFGRRRRPRPRALSSDGATHGSLKREADEKGPKRLPGHLIATIGRRRRRHSATGGGTRIASAARRDGMQRDATRAGVADVAMAPLGPAASC